MRAAAIFGLGTSQKSLKPFQKNSGVEWTLGLPGTSADCNAVVIFGGDGTVHRHLSPLVKLGLPVLVVPVGSGNDFARALGFKNVGKTLAAWTRFTESGKNVHKIDLGLITPLKPSRETEPPEIPAAAIFGQHKYFCCVAGCGLDVEVTRRANHLPRWLRRHGGYALSLPAALARFVPFVAKLSVPNRDANDVSLYRDAATVLLACANTPVYGAGMKIAPRAVLDDGKLDICQIVRVSKLKLLLLFPSVYAGNHLSIKEVEYFQTSKLQIHTTDPVDLYADGEYVCQTPVEISVSPAALNVIVP